MTMNRRDFLGCSTTIAAAGAIGSSLRAQDSPTPPAPTPEKVRVGVVGVNGRGGQLMHSFQGLPNAEVVALCDVDSRVLDSRLSQLNEKGASAKGFGDFRAMIDRDIVDAVVVTTPNHWHALMAVWACDAGKHVYVEKPVSHTVAEGRAIVEAAQRNKCCVQTGTQSRSAKAPQQAIAYAQSGELGKITCARGICYKPRKSIGLVDGSQFVPSTIDYHRWLGPAPYEPLRRKRLHYDWHWYDQTGNGDLGNQGVHQMDIIRWGAGHDRLPDHAWSVGGRVGYDDNGNTPNTQVLYMEYNDGPPLLFEVRGLPQNKAVQKKNWSMDRYGGQAIGVVLHCENGEVRIPSGYARATAHDLDGKQIKEWKGGGNHQANFINAVIADDPSKLNAPIIQGHLSSACCHLGLVSTKLGHAGTMDEAIAAAPDVLSREAIERMQQHVVANEVPASAQFAVGKRIPIDSAREGSPDPQAQALFTKDYRAPFVLSS